LADVDVDVVVCDDGRGFRQQVSSGASTQQLDVGQSSSKGNNNSGWTIGVFRGCRRDFLLVRKQPQRGAEPGLLSRL